MDESVSEIRQQRNYAEKQRRDKLNGYISQLANAVPMVAMSTKRLDKTSILRLSAAYLRLHQSPLVSNGRKRLKSSNTQSWKPHHFTIENLKHLLDVVEGFVFVTTCHGKIIYVSHNAEKFLGHQNIEMIGNSLTSFLHPSDIENVYDKIQSAYEQIIKGNTKCAKVTFDCRLRERNQPRAEVITYQMVRISGRMQLEDDTVSEKQINCEGTSKEIDNNGLNILFKGFVQVIPTNPMSELSLMDANLDEYVSRHSMDGTLLFADHRISNIIGFLPNEVIGQSAYSFILPDDHCIALFAHRLMLSNSNGRGVVVHRLRTKTGSYVFLQSAGCLQYDRTTGQIDHWVCVSRLLVENEGDKERDKFVKRFTPHIANSSSISLYESLQIIIGPKGTSEYPATTNELFSGASSKQSSVRIEEIENVSPLKDQNIGEPLKSCSISKHSEPQNEVQILSNVQTVPQGPNTTQNVQTVPQRPNTTQFVQLQMPSDCSNTSGISFTSSPLVSVHNTVQPTLFSVNSIPLVQINQSQHSMEIDDNQINLNNEGINSLIPGQCMATQPHNNYQCNQLASNNVNTILVNNKIVNIGMPGNVQNLSYSGPDFTHLLGAAVLTFDSQHQPVISVYSPSIGSSEIPQQMIAQRSPLTPSPRELTSPNDMEPNFYSPPLPKNNNSFVDVESTSVDPLMYEGTYFDSTQELSNSSHLNVAAYLKENENEYMDESRDKEVDLLASIDETTLNLQLNFESCTETMNFHSTSKGSI